MYGMETIRGKEFHHVVFFGIPGVPDSFWADRIGFGDFFEMLEFVGVQGVYRLVTWLFTTGNRLVVVSCPSHALLRAVQGPQREVGRYGDWNEEQEHRFFLSER